MILLLTTKDDLTTDYVVRELQRRSENYIRINTEDIAYSQVTWSPTDDVWSITLGDRILNGRDIASAYYRRPARPRISHSAMSVGERHYCEIEWEEFLKSLYIAIDDRWLNRPERIAIAEHKPLQLFKAVNIGLNVPKTIVTNSIRAAYDVAENHEIIGKPLRQALVATNDGEDVIFTTKIDLRGGTAARELALAPIIIQHELRKRADIRVTVVGSKAFSVEIASQEHPETTTDWRVGAHTDLLHTIHALPSDVSDKCIALVKKFGLQFGAIDLVLDRDGKYWFLEINPNGQWAWIEARTGLPITAAIADELVRRAVE